MPNSIRAYIMGFKFPSQCSKILTSERVKKELIKLFCKATEIVEPIGQMGPVKVLFVRKRFVITIPDDMVALRVREMLIYDLSKIEKIPDERYIIPAFVEEFVHCFLDSDDEDLVARKTVELYPALMFDQKSGKYLPRSLTYYDVYSFKAPRSI